MSCFVQLLLALPKSNEQRGDGPQKHSEQEKKYEVMMVIIASVYYLLLCQALSKPIVSIVLFNLQNKSME